MQEWQKSVMIWRLYAEGLRTIAEHSEADCKSEILTSAEEWERLAARTERIHLGRQRRMRAA